jgi:hypothetical protein
MITSLILHCKHHHLTCMCAAMNWQQQEPTAINLQKMGY